MTDTSLRSAAPTQGARSRRVPRSIAVAALLAALVVAPARAVAADDETPAPVANVRSVLERWVETERVLSKERQEWAVGQEMLRDRIALVEREIGSLRERIAEAQDSIDEVGRKQDELTTQSEHLRASSATLALALQGLEGRTRDLLRRLPEPILERVAPLAQRLPVAPGDAGNASGADGADGAGGAGATGGAGGAGGARATGDEVEPGSLGTRFQSVVGILNEVDKFNREVTLESEVRTLGDGRTAEVMAMYLGLGQAWYATHQGDAAGVGRPTPEGWSWTSANESAPAIARAIAIARNEEPAAFVPLPITVLDEESQP